MFAADTQFGTHRLGSYYPKTVELSSAKLNAYNSKPGPRLEGPGAERPGQKQMDQIQKDQID